MTEITIEQAVYGAFDGGGYRFVARSPGFREDWLEPAQQLCTGFGERPAGMGCPAAVFVQPLDRQYIAIVQVADQGIDDAGRPGALGFHLMVLPRVAYRALGGDPFQLAERQSPPWHARGDLPVLSWPAERLSPRTVEQVRRVLQRPDGPNLLGGSQVLVDGGRVVFVRSGPDSALLRDLWCLLPTSTRSELWAASFAFGNALRFHVLTVPAAEGDEYAHYHTEEQAGDYPEGRYELALQTAAEAGDQRELDRLFARRSQAETLRLGLVILAAAVIAALIVALFNPPQPPKASEPKRRIPEPASPAAMLQLPPPEHYAALTAEEQTRLAGRLGDLIERSGSAWRREVKLTRTAFLAANGPRASALADAAFFCADPAAFLGPEVLLDVLDKRLGTPDPRRDPGPLRDHGPVSRRLRVLSWKHGLASYNDERLNAFELLERIEPLIRRQP